VKYHFIRTLVQQNKIRLVYCNTKNQLADIFTKGTNGPRLKEMQKWTALGLLTAGTSLLISGNNF
jgi:hypothetical protein